MLMGFARVRGGLQGTRTLPPGAARGSRAVGARGSTGRPASPPQANFTGEAEPSPRVDLDIPIQMRPTCVFFFHTAASRRVEPRRARRGVRPASSYGYREGRF